MLFRKTRAIRRPRRFAVLIGSAVIGLGILELARRNYHHVVPWTKRVMAKAHP